MVAHCPISKLTCLAVSIPIPPTYHPVILTAIAAQHKLTYGLSRSPILAALQNVPSGLSPSVSTCLQFCPWLFLSYPDLFLSKNAGKTPCRYVQVQMKRRTTRRRVWNLRMPSWEGLYLAWVLCDTVLGEGGTMIAVLKD